MTRNIDWHDDMLFFRKIVEEAGIIAWITMEDGYCVYHSPSWFSFTGAHRDAAAGYEWLELVHPEDRTKTRKNFFEAVDQGSEYGLSYRLRKADGSFQLVWGHGVPRRSKDCNFLGYLGMTQPIEQYTSKIDELAKIWVAEPGKPLSVREREVMLLVAEGHTNEKIAQELEIHVRTVEHHVSRAVDKLGANNRVHAVAKAMKLNEL